MCTAARARTQGPPTLVCALGILCFVALLGACASDSPEGSQVADESRSVIRARALEFVPFESLTDVVSFSDHVAVIEVVSETVAPPATITDQGTESLRSRSVSVRVEDVLRSHPGAPLLPQVLSLATSGVFVSDDGTASEIAAAGPRLEVGRRYLAILSVFPGEVWGLMNSAAAFELSGDRVLALAGDSGIRADLSGGTVDDFMEAVNAASPYAGLEVGGFRLAIDRVEVVFPSSRSENPASDDGLAPSTVP